MRAVSLFPGSRGFDKRPGGQPERRYGVPRDNAGKDQRDYAAGIQFIIGRLKGEKETTVQSILFDGEQWDEDDAREWLGEHDFKAGKLDKTENKLRFRQRNPGDFEDDSFRTIAAGRRDNAERGNGGRSYATKTEDGKEHPAGDYAYVPDPDKPSTWRLRLASTPGGGADARLVGAAIAAIGKDFRGNSVRIPAADRPAVLHRIKAAWKKANSDKGDDDLPEILKGQTFAQDDDFKPCEECDDPDMCMEEGECEIEAEDEAEYSRARAKAKGKRQEHSYQQQADGVSFRVGRFRDTPSPFPDPYGSVATDLSALAGNQIQAVIFSRDKFTLLEALTWLRENQMYGSRWHDVGTTFEFEMWQPTSFDEQTMRVVDAKTYGSPNQPRDPAGSPTGGQWSSGGGGMSPGEEGVAAAGGGSPAAQGIEAARSEANGRKWSAVSSLLREGLGEASTLQQRLEDQAGDLRLRNLHGLASKYDRAAKRVGKVVSNYKKALRRLGPVGTAATQRAEALELGMDADSELDDLKELLSEHQMSVNGDDVIAKTTTRRTTERSAPHPLRAYLPEYLQ